MSTVVKDLGAVSAYAYAVEKGYTGTEEEFAELMADYANVGQRAENAADSALESKSAAQTAAQTATNKASEATTAAQTATTKAGEAQTSAQTASNKASEASQSASQALSYKTGAESAKTASQTAQGLAESARDDAITAKTAAVTAQGKAEDAQAAAESVAESIPSDYSQMSEDVSELKEGLSDLQNDISNITDDTITSANMFDGVFGIVGAANVDGTFITNTRFMRSDYLPLKEGLGRTLYTSNSAGAWASVIVYAEDKSCFGAIANARPLPDEARYFVVTKAKETTAEFYVGTSPFSGDYSYSTAKMIKSDALQNGLRKKSVVLMGDSTYAITGKSGARISDFLALLGDCAVTNCSFGGTRLSDSRGATSVNSYKPFDFPNLVDAIVANDFTTQNDSLSGKTSEFIINLSNLEGVDFSKVDCLILAYGANDFTGSVNIGANTSDRTTFRGALIYGVDTLLSAFPNLMIVVDGQRYRAWLNASTKVFEDDVFTHRNNNDQLTSDYINALESQCALMGVPYFNNLYHYGWNKYTRINYFPAVESGASASSADGAHFDVRGVKYAASVLYKNLCMLGFAQNL